VVKEVKHMSESQLTNKKSSLAEFVCDVAIAFSIVSITTTIYHSVTGPAQPTSMAPGFPSQYTARIVVDDSTHDGALEMYLQCNGKSYLLKKGIDGKPPCIVEYQHISTSDSLIER
jgi:hypothetical protein